MADDILKFLGVNDPDVDTHPHKGIAEFLGIAPDVLKATPADPYGLGPPEARFEPGYGKTPDKSFGQRVHEKIDPGTVLPAIGRDIGGNIAESAVSAARMATEGAGDIMENKGATGVGKGAMGTLGVALSPLTGTVKSGENLLRDVTGNPDFASKAALMVPFNVGKPVAATAARGMMPSTKAADEVVNMLGGPEAAREALKKLETNPRLRLVDVSDPLRVGAQSLIDPAQPNAMSKVVKSAETSIKTAPDAVRAAYDTHLGPAPNPVKEMQTLMQKAQTVGQTKIQPALNAARPVDLTPVLTHVDKILVPTPVKMAPGTQITPTPLQQRLAELRRDIAAGESEVLTDPGRLHSIQSDLRREAQELIDARGSGARLGRQLMDVRNKIVDQIDAVSPKIPDPNDPTKLVGSYKKGLEEFRDVKDVTRAFEQGAGILVNAKGVSEKALETHPEALKDWMKTASAEEIAARRLGARYAVAQKMDAMKNAALAGTDVGKVDLSRQKYEILFGKQETDKMWKLLEDEREIAHSNSRIMGNSKTAETLAAREHLKPREVMSPSSGMPGLPATIGLAGAGLTSNPTIGALIGLGLYGARGAKSGAQWLGRQSDFSRNATFADLVTSTDRQATIPQIQAAISRAGSRNKLKNLVVPP